MKTLTITLIRMYKKVLKSSTLEYKMPLIRRQALEKHCFPRTLWAAGWVLTRMHGIIVNAKPPFFSLHEIRNFLVSPRLMTFRIFSSSNSCHFPRVIILGSCATKWLLVLKLLTAGDIYLSLKFERKLYLLKFCDRFWLSCFCICRSRIHCAKKQTNSKKF